MATKLNLGIRPHSSKLAGCHKDTVLIKGAGAEFPKLPSDLGEAAFSVVPRSLKGRKSSKLILGSGHQSSPVLGLLGPQARGGFGGLINPVAAALPGDDDPDFAALRAGANCIQGLIIERQLDDLLENTFGFGDLFDGIADGKRLPQRFQEPVSAHEKVVNTLHPQVKTAMMKVLKKLAAANPDAKMGELMQAAVQAVGQKVGPIIGILNAYTLAFKQNTNGRFAEQLLAINDFMESCFAVYQGGDMDAFVPGAPIPTPLSMKNYQVGDKLLAAFGGDGLGTIPGGKGPVGLHLLLVQLDMQDWVPQGFPLLGHESTHQTDDDVVVVKDGKIITLLEYKQAALKKALTDAFKSGKLKLTSEKTRIGRYSVPTIDLLVKLFAGDCCGEISADLGGILQLGGSLHTSMLLSFPAWVVRNGRVKDAKELIRTDTVYSISEGEEGMELEFEAHPPDWMRTEISACQYDDITMPDHGSLLRRMAKFCVGGTVPQFLEWHDAEEKSDAVIRIATADIRAAAPYCRAIVRTPLPPLLNKPQTDYVMWTPKREAKMRALANLQLAGKSDYSGVQGTIYPHLFGAASATAFSDAIVAGRDPEEARQAINAACYGMFKQYRDSKAK
jgi:hypothetical protein